MAVLLSYRTSEGANGACDATCYSRKRGRCACLCGGINHGKGLAQARLNTAEHAANWIASIKAAHPGEIIEFDGEGAQLSLIE